MSKPPLPRMLEFVRTHTLALSAATLATLLPGLASAQTSTLIDDFSVGQDRVSSFTNGAESSSVSQGVEASITGGERDISVTRLGGGGAAAIDVFPDPGVLTFSTGGGGTFGRATIVWDGDDDAGETNSIDFDGLRTSADAPIDLTFGGLTDQLDITTSSGDTLPLTVRITLYADAGNSASIERTQPNGNQTLSFRFSDFDFTGDPAGFDITDVGAIRLDLITASNAAGLDADVDFVQASSSVTVTMVDQVLDSAGNTKTGPALSGDTIRYTVTIENPDDPGSLASTPFEFRFDPALPPTSGLTTLVPGSVNVPNPGDAGATVVEGNGGGDARVRVSLDPIPDRTSPGNCGSDNTATGCVTFTFDVVVGQTLPADLLRQLPEGVFLPAQGTLISVVRDRISTTLRTDDLDVVSPPRDGAPRPLETLTLVERGCGNGVVDPDEGCDDGNRTGGDGCNESCLIESIEEVKNCFIDDCTPPPSTCTPGSVGCPRCNDGDRGRTGSASCTSGFCSSVGGVAVCMNCGNGRVDGQEGCDEPGRAASAECTASCLVTPCPTGIDCDPTCTIIPGALSDPTCHTCTSNEHCDSMDCRVLQDGRGICVAVDCGDGILQASEGCDDGNRTAGDGCNASCRVESCTTYPDCDRTCEQVPGRPSTSDPPCSACNDTAPGHTGGDSCASGLCDRDDGTGICMPSPVCGNGTLEIGEGCDDSNTMNGDGCNAMCRIESIEAAGTCRLGDCPDMVTSCVAGSPNCPACNTMGPGKTGHASCESGFCNADGFCQDCGDGNLDTYEGCDDMNNAGADGCSVTCLIESCSAGQSCPVAPDCLPGSQGCNVCNDEPDGATGDASCESDYCDPNTNTCGPRLPRRDGGGCATATADPGLGLGLMIVLFMRWLLRSRRRPACPRAT
jgi:cysteine-rich repeat protein